MNETTSSLQVFNLDVPETAPRVRITTGLGTATQKSWNLRRPVTLIGSRRPAHIVLHDRKISSAHCVIVNTGSDVLLKDLHTSGGTYCGGTSVDLVALKDGDVITLGALNIQVAIQVPQDVSADSARGLQFTDPTTFPEPVTVRLLHTHERWRLCKAVALIGRHVAAKIYLDNERVSRRHAIFFRFNGAAAVFDIGGEEGIRVNGSHCSLAPLHDGDRIRVGSFRLVIGSSDETVSEPQDPVQDSVESLANQLLESAEKHEPPMPAAHVTANPEAGGQAGNPSGGALDTGFGALTKSITDSWDQLNSWQSQLLDEATQLSKQQTDLATREAELDARDAALRGHLHDVERMEEQLTQRERELNAQISRLHTEQDKLEEAQTTCTAREADIARRATELSRREHVFAQRWSRIQGAPCPHCGKTIKM